MDLKITDYDYDYSKNVNKSMRVPEKICFEMKKTVDVCSDANKDSVFYPAADLGKYCFTTD